ncbi:cytochrome P450 [Bacillus sp. Marseille-P3661]|uniref:cytochrome P450 n=1 Tax=Bacillus sp. Marseille-P3661 TaxID=1936234 RepID=UPI0015E15C0C|nr:cytochrome P450 [Bacillus sp. Marseille-P3661]
MAHTDQVGGAWGFFKYEDIVKATLDIETFSNGESRNRDLPRYPLEADPPFHTAYRKILQPFFNSRVMDEWEHIVRNLVIEMLEPLIFKKEMDMAKDFNYILPVRVILSFLHLPDQDCYRIGQLSEDIYHSSYGKNPEKYAATVESLKLYCHKAVAGRKTSPLDPQKDMISKLLQSQIDNQDISVKSVAGILHLLLTAGHDSTTSSLGIIINYLAQNPNDQKRIRENTSLIPMAIEEILRYETPVQRMPRTITKDFDLHGQKLKKGEKVFLVWGSANRDEEVFDNADKCIIDRKPNRHLVFGHGIHHCLGAPLARLELRVALEELLHRTKSFELNGNVVRTGYPRFGVSSLPLILCT